MKLLVILFEVVDVAAGYLLVDVDCFYDTILGDVHCFMLRALLVPVCFWCFWKERADCEGCYYYC